MQGGAKNEHDRLPLQDQLDGPVARLLAGEVPNEAVLVGDGEIKSRARTHAQLPGHSCDSWLTVHLGDVLLRILEAQLRTPMLSKTVKNHELVRLPIRTTN